MKKFTILMLVAIGFLIGYLIAGMLQASASESGSMEIYRAGDGSVVYADEIPTKTGVFATSDLKKYRAQVVQALDKPGTMVPAEWETKSKKRVDFLWLEKVKICKAAVTYDKAAKKIWLVPGCGGEVPDRTDVNIDVYMTSLMIVVGLSLLGLLFKLGDFVMFAYFITLGVVLFTGVMCYDAYYRGAWYFGSIVLLQTFVSIGALVSVFTPYKVGIKWYMRMTFSYVALAVVIGVMHVNGYGW